MQPSTEMTMIYSVLYITVSMAYTIIDTMKISIHLFLKCHSEDVAFLVATILYSISLYGALTLLFCVKKDRSAINIFIRGTVGLVILLIIGLFVCMPLCVHAIIYDKIGTLQENVYYFWLENYSNRSPYFIFYCAQTVAAFIITYAGSRILCKR